MSSDIRQFENAVNMLFDGLMRRAESIEPKGLVEAETLKDGIAALRRVIDDWSENADEVASDE